jgi:hypothetical protein
MHGDEGCPVKMMAEKNTLRARTRRKFLDALPMEAGRVVR